MTGGLPDLREQDCDPDPLAQFRAWFAQAAKTTTLAEAAALATAAADGQPSVRMVLVKGWDQDGFVFYTNYESRKGQELTTNPRAALLFHWSQMGRQVRVEGPVQPVDPAESDRYFASRPKASQLSAAVSAQSKPIESRGELEQRFGELERSLQQAPVPRPEWWGGFRLQPASFEFWQDRPDRLHDRIRYLRDGPVWQLDRLQP